MRILLPATATLTSLLLWASCASSPEPGAGADSPLTTGPQNLQAKGSQLYAAHCAVCHGERGAGDGSASPYLFPAARDFTWGRFRLVSTTNGVPTDADLVRTIRRGVPGSAMPAWHWMADADVEALAAYVRELATEGLAFEMMLTGKEQDEAVELASARLTPGSELPRVAAVDPTRDVLDRGRALFVSHCASCHGEDCAGLNEPRFDDDGRLNWPRDFTEGYLKGGHGATELGWRIQAGLPGTAMPGLRIEQRDLEALVAYVRSEIDPQAETNLVHRRERIVARRVAELPLAPDDLTWAQEGETRVVLAPLTSSPRGTGITSAYVAAQHDGQRVTVRVRWADPTGDSRIHTDLLEPDACALQFTADESPKLFGMGSETHRTNIWHWKALRLDEVAGALDLIEPAPHLVARSWEGRAVADVPVYRPSLSVPGVSETVDSRSASGVGRIALDEHSGSVIAEPVWADGEWTVVFTRTCAPPAPDDVALPAGSQLNVSLAIWNGSAGDRGARKSISVWQVFELEP